ncbi:MAG: DNA (cytosine-5-)-methyltransferase [Deltaproteobacteria bacterium]|nr:DNA (cytosine-5-)-methyltransferase [Deltaproteobacteria bacterium]
MYNLDKGKTTRNQSGDLLQDLTFAEFFAGIGLMRMGLEQAGWRAVFANDIARDKYEMYSAHFGEGDSHFLLDDIHNLDQKQIPSVTMATASFPCNDLSLAGMRKGLGGKQSSAYWGFVRILDEMEFRRPPIVLLENVAGFLTSHGGRDFQAALLALNRLGYAVDAMIIDASLFVPQSRVRLFVVGTLRNGCANWKISENLRFYESALRPKALADFIFTHPEIVWNLRQLPPPQNVSLSLSDKLEDLPDHSPFWWSKERRDYLVNQMSEKHYKQLKRMMDKKSWSYGTVFRRIRKGRSMAELRTDGVAGCLRTPRGGSGRQILLQAGFGKVKVRLLTPRECAKLMGADDFFIDVPLNQALFGFGDAVCVPVISWIAKQYLNPVVEDMRTSAKYFRTREKTIKNGAVYGAANEIESIQGNI